MSIHPRKSNDLDLTALRARLAGESGPRYWRGLEELAETEEFQEFLHREFPENASEWTDPASRRTFLKLMGASLALAGVGGCSHQPIEKVVPYVRMPEEIVPGKPLKYATAVTLGGFGIGVVAESHMGRPTMLEGNGLHPDSLGAMNPFAQAALLTLYDPDRSQVVTHSAPEGREINTWDSFFTKAIQALDARRTKKGEGVRVLTETVTSPTLARMLRALFSEFPEAKWHQYEPCHRDSARLGARLAFGEDVETRYHFDKANVILALDADFLTGCPGHLRHARDFGARREPNAPGGMNRLYSVEPSPTVTGAMADHRLPLRARDIAGFAQEVARKLEVKFTSDLPATIDPERSHWVDALVGDLQQRKNKGASLVVAGDGQPPAVHALAHALNQALGNVGKTVVYTAPVEAQPVDQGQSIRDLYDALGKENGKEGAVEVLLILGGNPVFGAPADCPEFTERLAKVPLSAHLGQYEDETSAACVWHVPEAHELEAWGDVRGCDGTATIQQPLIAPLYGGRSASELIAALMRNTSRSGYDIVRDTWKGHKKGEDFETFWRKSVHDGVVAETTVPIKQVTVKDNLRLTGAAPKASGSGGLELVFRPDPTVWDGRYANNGWLQELPKPLTKLTWDNVALLSPKLAERRQLASSDLVDLDLGGGRTLRAPVWVLPGQAEESVTVHLGYGRTQAGRVGNGMGFNAYPLRSSLAPGFVAGLAVKKVGEKYLLATTQLHRIVESLEESNAESRAAERRGIVRVATLADFLQNPKFAQEPDRRHEVEFHEGSPRQDTLYPPIRGSTSRLTDVGTGDEGHETNYAWGMAVNLNTCIGCNACVTACQAENNIPVVGKEQVYRGREMHWMDIDRYYHGSLDNPETYHQPRLCMHCEKAPCELVCPVAATVHDSEGLNVMVYNRCVGTRYCGNNCPYKVRHFNFLQYSDQKTPSLKLLNNPDVTVRARGVMEKCTYCVQRINQARYTAEEQHRPIQDGEFQTACQAACPTRAIVFGNVNDPNSAVSKLKADPRNYGMLAELNTRPRTSYVAKLRNPNPEIETEPRDGV